MTVDVDRLAWVLAGYRQLRDGTYQHLVDDHLADSHEFAAEIARRYAGYPQTGLDPCDDRLREVLDELEWAVDVWKRPKVGVTSGRGHALAVDGDAVLAMSMVNAALVKLRAALADSASLERQTESEAPRGHHP